MTEHENMTEPEEAAMQSVERALAELIDKIKEIKAYIESAAKELSEALNEIYAAILNADRVRYEPCFAMPFYSCVCRSEKLWKIGRARYRPSRRTHKRGDQKLVGERRYHT